MPKSGKKVVHFYNKSGSLENVVQFLEKIKKKVNYINLTVKIDDGCKVVKITLFGSRDLQYLAIERIKELSHQFFN